MLEKKLYLQRCSKISDNLERLGLKEMSEKCLSLPLFMIKAWQYCFFLWILIFSESNKKIASKEIEFFFLKLWFSNFCISASQYLDLCISTYASVRSNNLYMKYESFTPLGLYRDCQRNWKHAWRSNNLSVQTDGVNLWCFKLWLFDLVPLIVWNIKDLRNQVA